eukprot:Skav212287  [mRNA]  locus=scaffold732:431610:436260:- [translate_table: standard]
MLAPQALLQAELEASRASEAAARRSGKELSQAISRGSTRPTRTSQMLRDLAAEPSSSSGSEGALRRQALAGVSVLFQNALNSYFQAQVSFRQEMESKVSRQLKAAFPQAEESAPGLRPLHKDPRIHPK